MMKVPVVCDVIQHELTLYLYTNVHCAMYYKTNTDHFPCLLFPLSEVHLTVVFMCVWT